MATRVLGGGAQATRISGPKLVDSLTGARALADFVAGERGRSERGA